MYDSGPLVINACFSYLPYNVALHTVKFSPIILTRVVLVVLSLILELSFNFITIQAIGLDCGGFIELFL